MLCLRIDVHVTPMFHHVSIQYLWCLNKYNIIGNLQQCMTTQYYTRERNISNLLLKKFTYSEEVSNPGNVLAYGLSVSLHCRVPRKNRDLVRFERKKILSKLHCSKIFGDQPHMY